MISHPFMRSTQPKDPFRHPPVVKDDTYIEPDMPQYQMTAVAMEEAPAHAPFHAEQPRHAMVTYIFITLNFILFKHVIWLNLIRCCQCHRRLSKQQLKG